ncbi:MAG: MFS transporter [Dehalococcoidia bacterium]|nr:MFS transporter [Dehalococcoidia bacterium]
MIRTFVSLKERNFRYLILGSVGMGFGQWFQQIGLLWLMKVITESPTLVGVLAAVRGGTVLIAAPIGGVLADRMSRRLLIVLVTLVSAAQALGLAILVATNQIQVWHLYAFAVLEAITSGINQPTRQTFIYDVTSRENITNAISLNAMVQSTTRIIGPNIAGMMIGLVGTASCFFVLAAMKMGASFATLMISASVEQPSTQKKESPWASFVGGVRYAVTDPAILALLLISSTLPLLVYPYNNFLPFFADRVFNVGAQGYGFLASALAFGAVPGGLLIASLGNFKGKGLLMMVAYLGYVALVLLFSRQDIIWFGAACLMAAGVFHAMATTLTFTLLQLWVRNDMRGRVIALHSMEGGLNTVGSLPMGMAVSAFGPQNTVTATTAVALVAVGVISLLSSQLRKEPEAVQEEERQVPKPA